MELVYLWVEDYKNIHEQGFNFSPRFRCAYDGETLTIDENDDYIPDFFGENINVTAIVGKNGSGKSTVLELLTKKNDVSTKYLFKLLYNIDENRFYIDTKSFIPTVVFKSKEIDIVKNYLKNIIYYAENFSTNTLINEDIYNISFTNFLHKISAHYSNDYGEELSIQSLIDIALLNIKTYEIVLIKKFGFIPGIKKLPENILLLSPDHYALYSYDLISFAIYLIRHFGNDECEMDFYSSVEIEEDKIRNIEELENKIYIHGNEKSIQIFEMIRKFLYEYEKILKVAQETDENLVIPIKDINQSFMTELDNLILQSPLDSKALNFDLLQLKWDYELSTGEDTFLQFYSMLYQVIKKNKLFDNNIILLIDELDNYLHPDWQSKIIRLIIDFFKIDKLQFKGNIQIILTTHSPFLLSDIPKQNIIFLDKDEQGNCKVVDGLNDKKQTFGANIHTLLSDSFFMEDGLMGEFAKSKINKVIDILNPEKATKEDLEYCEKIIPIIGEPIVKNQLQKMLDSKKLPKVGEIDKIHEEIEALQSRLKDLEVKDDKK